MIELQNKLKGFSYLKGESATSQMLSAYQVCLDTLKKEHFKTLSDVQLLACLPVIKCLILKRLHISLQHFRAVEQFLYTKQVDIHCYIGLLNIQAEIFYSYEVKRKVIEKKAENIVAQIDQETHTVFAQIAQNTTAMHFVGKMLDEVRDDHFIEELLSLSMNVEPIRDAYMVAGEEVVVSVLKKRVA
jgi:hypothetical protein